MVPNLQKLFTKLNVAVFVSFWAEFDEFCAKTDNVYAYVPNLTVEAIESKLTLTLEEPVKLESGNEETRLVVNPEYPETGSKETVALAGSGNDNTANVLLFPIVTSEGEVEKLNALTAVNDKTKSKNVESILAFMLICCNFVITMVYKYFYGRVCRFFIKREVLNI
jgi:hypothetical protein